MKLSSTIAKQMRIKQLNQGILHNQTRSKYRNYKLKQHYDTPAPCHAQVVMYSNLHGNQFVVRNEHFEAAHFDHPAETYLQICELQRQVNAEIYGLWLRGKCQGSDECFPFCRRLLLWSIVGLWVFALLLCLAVKSIENISKIKETAEWIMIAAIVIVIMINLAVFLNAITRKYSRFEYDNQVVKAVASKVRKSEQKFQQLGIEVTCDREITWICFRKINKPSLIKAEGVASPEIKEQSEQ